MKVIILAGGQGTRLFPLSKEDLPKQFVRLGERSLFSMTVERHREDKLYVTLRSEYLSVAREQVDGLHNAVEFIEEPAPKNTFPAIVWSLYVMRSRFGLKEEDVIAVVPSDHYIDPVNIYREDLDIAEDLAREGFITVFGVKPSRPDTGFGYIKIGRKNGKAYQVEEFTEKPTKEKALEYLSSGSYLWNSGIFVFSVGTFMEECRKYQPLSLSIFEAGSEEEAREQFKKLPSLSVDKAVIERSGRLICLPFRAKWSDVGTFRGLYEVLCDDEKCVVLSGDVLKIDSEDVLVYSEDKPVVIVGAKNLGVINTNDFILVVSLDHSQKVKDIVHQIDPQIEGRGQNQ